ncbi:unnamed protein product, partial [Prorocentrum cordatum]
PFAPSSPRRFRSIRARVCARAPWEFMARVGVSEFYSSLQGPRDRQQTWRETIARMNYWDHPFHPLNERPPEPSYKGLSTSSGGDLRQPWELLALSRRHVGPLDMRDTYLGGTGTRMKCSSYHGRASASSGASSHRLGTQRGGQDTAAFASSFNDRTLKASASCGALPWRQRLVGQLNQNAGAERSFTVLGCGAEAGCTDSSSNIFLCGNTAATQWFRSRAGPRGGSLLRSAGARRPCGALLGRSWSCGRRGWRESASPPAPAARQC